MYHVINRGNYRRDVFDSVGAAKAFVTVLAEGCESFGWRLHAYVIMRNHFHLALETPEPNLVEGMHWLQSTYSTRFNRIRSERGHLFQGRYQALLIEDAAAVARVVNYIHLNPVRAKIVPATQVGQFRWSSLVRFQQPNRPGWLVCSGWLEAIGCADTPEGWKRYLRLLAEVETTVDPKREHEEFCRGWAIGTAGWRRAVAQDHEHLALSPGVTAGELRDFRHAKWEAVLQRLLKETGQTLEMAVADAKGAAWKHEVAERLRREAAAPHAWIAARLHMGSPNSVRSYLSRRRAASQSNQQLSA